MRLSPRVALTVLLLPTLCAGCAATAFPPILPTVPPALLQLTPEPPPPPAAATDVDLAAYLVQLAGWGRACNAQLGDVARLLDSPESRSQ